jgi:hypothetical protein
MSHDHLSGILLQLSLEPPQSSAVSLTMYVGYLA